MKGSKFIWLFDPGISDADPFQRIDFNDVWPVIMFTNLFVGGILMLTGIYLLLFDN